MIKWILSLLIVLGLTSIAYAVTPKEVGKILANSVVRLENGSSTFCTASKIGPRLFLTAKHCKMGIGSNTRIVHGTFAQFIRSLTFPTQEKSTGRREEDWMFLNASYSNEDIAELYLGCDDEIYLGMPIAYGGYPQPLNFTMAIGRIISLEKVDSYRHNLDFVIDVHAAPGSSGSPIINLDTGNVIGILTEGVSAARAGAFAIGVEHVGNLDICEDRDEIASP